LEEFPFHTDASFESPTPRYVGLYVVRADRYGGGRSLLVHTKDVLEKLGSEDAETLRLTNFKFLVPEEFYKGSSYSEHPILFDDSLIRYRREILDLSQASKAQHMSIAALDQAIMQSQHVSFNLPNGALLLFDNGKYLHGRSEIMDSDRHLLRMRFF
jgi:alpha-ketoglutarate-dependent taurine dioxygenase